MNITSEPFELNCPLFTHASEMRPQPAFGQCLGGQEVAWKQEGEQKLSLHPSWLPTWDLLRW